MMKWAVIQFPGSNSDLDAYRVFERLPGIKPVMHWSEDEIPKGEYQVILLPGGFSYGDYLRAGAIAKLAPAIQSLEAAIEAGAHAIGICNGFQILLEARLIPGVLQANSVTHFISRFESCKIESPAFPWFQAEDVGRVVKLPIAHGYGNYQIRAVDRTEVQAVLKYENNPNGSVDSIAGVYRQLGNGSVFGLMPHPERASFSVLPRHDGELFWNNALQNLKKKAA